MRRLRMIMMSMLLAAMVSGAMAQRIGWQVRGGLGGSSVIGVSDVGWRTVWHISGGADIALSKSGVWRIQPSLLLSGKGWTFEGYYGDCMLLPADYTTKLSYLELPVMLAARLPIGKQQFITFRAGPYVAYGLSAKTTVDNRDTDHRVTTTGNHFSEECDFYGVAYDMNDYKLAYPKFHRWDVGISEGIDLTFGHFLIGADLSLGLVSISDKQFKGNILEQVPQVFITGGSALNFTAGVSVGYQF